MKYTAPTILSCIFLVSLAYGGSMPLKPLEYSNPGALMWNMSYGYNQLVGKDTKGLPDDLLIQITPTWQLEEWKPLRWTIFKKIENFLYMEVETLCHTSFTNKRSSRKKEECVPILQQSASELKMRKSERSPVRYFKLEGLPPEKLHLNLTRPKVIWR